MTGIMTQYILDNSIYYNWSQSMDTKYIKNKLINENYSSKINIIKMQQMSYDEFINYVENSRETN